MLMTKAVGKWPEKGCGHLRGLNKMAAILQTTFMRALMKETFCILIQIMFNFVPRNVLPKLEYDVSYSEI